jgi:serine/threonine protein kinase
MTVLDPNGKEVPLGSLLGGGGEAEIFQVADKPQSAAKIYRKPTRHHEAKLKAMIASPPHDPTAHLGHATICWPESLLYDQSGSCIGFLMHRVDTSTHVPVLKIYNPLDRQAVSLSITWKYIVRTAENIAAAVEAIHSQKHVIGDFNESNVLVANNALVTLVDCDSMQVQDPLKGTIYRCLVGKPDFTPPELQGVEFGKADRTAVHDNFGLGVLLFLLLMEGTHPYNGIWRGLGDPPVLEKRIRNGNSPYAGDIESDFMPAAPPFEILPRMIREMFIRCFRDGYRDPSVRPDAAEWKTALSAMESELVECPESPRHIYSSHLPECPWCERKKLLGGIDAYPIQSQQIVRRPPPVIPPPTIPAPFPKPSKGVWWRRPLVKRSVAAAGLLAIGASLWISARQPIKELWIDLDIATWINPQPRLTLSPMTICTSLDEKGNPAGESDTFTLAQVRKSGIMVALKYAYANPQRNTFQFRWTIGTRTYETEVHKFEQATDFIGLNLGKNLPAGQHRIEFLVDGKVERESLMNIQSAPDAGVAAKSRPANSAQTIDPGLKNESAPTGVTIPAISEHQIQNRQGVDPSSSEQVETSRPETRSVVHQALHYHGIGSCTGQLRFTADEIEFTSNQHAFKFNVKEVKVGSDSIQDPGGRDWRFAIPGTDIQAVIGKWARGELFPASPGADSSITKAAPALMPIAPKVFKARHKHLLGGCQGELRFTGDSIEFTSDQHYVKYSLDQVTIQGDGVQDRSGRSWNFEIPGENPAQILRLWKMEKLFRQ